MCASYGYEDSATSVFGAVFIVGGIFGSAVFGIITELKKNYKFICVLLSCVSTLSPVLFLVALPTGSVAWVSIMCAFVGFFGLALLPVGLDFAVEITYPLPEAISSGLMLTSCNVFGSMFSISGSILIGAYDTHMGTEISMGIYLGFSVVATIIFFFVKQDLKRIAMQE